MSVGRLFIVGMPSTEQSRQPDLIKVIALQSDTLLSIPSRNHTVHMADVGNVYILKLKDRDFAVYMYSTKPVKVFQFSTSSLVS